jgi:micrococcal nuclease
VAAVVAAAVVVAAGLGLGLAMRHGGSTGPGAQPGQGVVVRVVDGDTLTVRIEGRDERVRLIGIDTPESVDPDRPVECYGPEAADHLAQLLPPGTPVRLERDVEPRDPYDRLLAYAYRDGDGLLVNHALVAGGFAEASEFPPNTALSADLRSAEIAARRARVGMWGAC